MKQIDGEKYYTPEETKKEIGLEVSKLWDDAQAAGPWSFLPESSVLLRGMTAAIDRITKVWRGIDSVYNSEARGLCGCLVENSGSRYLRGIGCSKRLIDLPLIDLKKKNFPVYLLTMEAALEEVSDEIVRPAEIWLRQRYNDGLSKVVGL